MYCKKLFDGLDSRLVDKKTIDEIASELCPEVSKKRDKIIGLIKSHKGGDWLIENHEWLGYHVDKIRNPTGIAGAKKTQKNGSRLNKPSLKTKVPKEIQYKIWIKSLTTICDMLENMDDEFVDTTESRYRFKLHGISKRIRELRMILDGKVRF